MTISRSKAILYLLAMAAASSGLAFSIFTVVQVGWRVQEFNQAAATIRALGGHVSGPEMGPMGGTAGISRVYLRGPSVTDETLSALVPHLVSLPRLCQLTVLDSRVTDDGLVCLSELKNVPRISIGNCAVTGEGIDCLRGSLPNCEIDYGE